MYRQPSYDTRPVMPTSSARMIKPGIRATSTLYIAPKVKTVEQNEVFERPIVAPYTVVSNFMFTDEEVANPPTHARDGMPLAEELRLRRVGTMYIKELQKKLNDPPFFINERARASTAAACVAMVFYQRFYMYQSFTTFDPMSTAAAALFLACKSEECPRKMQEFAMLLYQTKHPEDPVMLEPSETEDVCNLIQSIESAILRTLAFELKMDLPHMDVIRSSVNMVVKKTTFCLCTDALAFSTLCLRYDFKIIAAGMLYMAACYHKQDLGKELGPLWYEAFNPSITEELLISISREMNQALKEIEPMINTSQPSQSIVPQEPIASQEDLSMPSLQPAPLPPPIINNHKKYYDNNYEPVPAKRSRTEFNIAAPILVPTVKLDPPQMYAFQNFIKSEFHQSDTKHFKNDDLEEGEIE